MREIPTAFAFGDNSIIEITTNPVLKKLEIPLTAHVMII